MDPRVPLGPGTRLGPYEVLASLGAGGMGEVYRCRDTRLDRTVALKVLPSEAARDPQAQQRLEREARAIAALDHPHICALHDIGRHDGIDYLVMEFLQGETLADRVARGALPIEQALDYAIQIADALDKAHRQGIVHRDLKPGNVMLTKSGAKLLDFGLAKSTVRGAAEAVTGSPTLDVTATGLVVGTVQYMAPEQLRGEAVDARADLYAFGAVLFEMISGRKAFQEQRQLSSLQPAVGPELERLVHTCLTTDPEGRWQTARDLLRELTWLRQRPAPVSIAGTAGSPAPRGMLVTVGRAAAIVAVTAAVAVIGTRYFTAAPASERQTARFQVQTPATEDLLSFAVSPDGQQLAFVAESGGAQMLWVRPLNRVTGQPLPGTAGAINPFWSPDGAALGFFAEGKLKRVDVSGGAPMVLADAPNGRGGTWGRDAIVFAPSTADALMRVPPAGGPATMVTQLANGQASHRWPQFLSDGRRFLFLATQGQRGNNGVFLASIDGGAPTLVHDEAAFAFAAPDRLLYIRQNVLVAQAFDEERGVLSGDAVAIADSVGIEQTMVRGAFSVSSNGVLAFRSTIAERRQLTWLDRAGKVLRPASQPDDAAPAGPVLSKDGRRLALSRILGGNTDVWLVQNDGGIPTRFTFHEAVEFFPIWSPDGNTVVFASNRTGAFDLYRKAATGVGDEQVLFSSPLPKLANDISPDGRILVYGMQVPKTGVDLWALPLAGGAAPYPVVQTPADEIAAQFSPNGRWLAYQSNASGRMEVYVRPFPAAGPAIPISAAGGGQVKWSPDGKELFYVAPDSSVMAVRIASAADGPTFAAAAPVRLFATRLATGVNVYPAVGIRAQYAAGPGGTFLIDGAIDEAMPPPITVVLNWDAALKP